MASQVENKGQDEKNEKNCPDRKARETGQNSTTRAGKRGQDCQKRAARIG
jgi:hypothetical protein